MNADYKVSDDYEMGLNNAVDKVVVNFKNNPDGPIEEPMCQKDVADQISRIANEIQQVIPLVLPKRDIAMQGEPEEKPQAPSVLSAAKNLLNVQVDQLKKLIGQLQ